MRERERERHFDCFAIFSTDFLKNLVFNSFGVILVDFFNLYYFFGESFLS